MRDIRVSRDMYMYSMGLIEHLHDSMDMNMVTALVYMASHAFMLFDLQKGAKIALMLILIAEATCEACDAKHTEVLPFFLRVTRYAR